MRRWGMLITLAYAVILTAFLVPLVELLNAHFRSPEFRRTFVDNVAKGYSSWSTWMFIGICVAGQVLLLFLSVDTTFQKIKPRAHILLSCLLTASASAVLSGAALLCIGFGIWSDRFGRHFFDKLNLFYAWAGLWLLWAVIFLIYFRNPSARISRVTSWLIRGSVLELLIAVPSHVIVRRRDDCSAPVATSFGIVMGIAIMLLCFGPSVLLLYKKRLDEYASRKAAAG